MKALIPLFSGLLFALGLALSGMTRPEKVTGFLDFTGAWDPSLAFVMLGAIGVHLVALRFAKRLSRPLAAAAFEPPGRERVDGRLVLGAALFGVGWGLAGYCPGPALVSVGSGSLPVLVVAGGMLAGVALFRLSARTRREPRQSPASLGARSA
ncbi:MAG: YeeE/YedE family protein [Polyangiaceae bacterium]|nr:YeeE/YedE family protein [Polyangiaceae bacterium]MCE7893948.1 YeeE/YedE family protein [Sorangiineae bacterium PRO1]MCL4755043.1 YeeE/YedE family protein [Myxococcales bacterium]